MSPKRQRPRKADIEPAPAEQVPSAFVLRKLDVLIASPGDAKAARDVVEQALHGWNDQRADDMGIMLRPRRWETGSVPILSEGDAQSVINTQLVDSSDILIGIFYHRLGSPTARAVSGTAEEINRAVAAKKPVHLYFSEKELPYFADLAQFEALRQFRSKIEKEGLISTFKSESELPVMILRAIDYDIVRHQLHGNAYLERYAAKLASELEVIVPDQAERLIGDARARRAAQLLGIREELGPRFITDEKRLRSSE
jgi:hypothetical protein